MKDVLVEIIAHKKIEVAELKTRTSVEELKAAILEKKLADVVSMKKSLESSPYGIISEFKRRSPSKGWINEKGVALEVTSTYEQAGASAVSILTDEDYFGGTLNDLISVNTTLKIPKLRKEFIVDEIQLYQARLAGADAVLLIASALEVEECLSLSKIAKELGLEILLEIHTEAELAYVNEYVDMVGVNNRNLGTFKTTLDNSVRLASLLPKDKLLVSESGIRTAEDIVSLRKHGFRGFLIGETFMRTDNPGQALKEFITDITTLLSKE
ncbi:MAG: indole-3-glycerol phosphate synthase TrpC [Rikenellaceae bacterium]